MKGLSPDAVAFFDQIEATLKDLTEVERYALAESMVIVASTQAEKLIDLPEPMPSLLKALGIDAHFMAMAIAIAGLVLNKDAVFRGMADKDHGIYDVITPNVERVVQMFSDEQERRHR